VEDLHKQIDGRKVTVAGAERTLATKDAQVVTYEPDWRTKLLATLSNPNVAFILLMIGFYGLVLEFWNPGSFIPGTVGGISLILALTALSALPLNYGALALLILGLGLMIGEAFTPGIGILGIGGVVAFVVGSVFLFEGADADIEIAVSLPLIIGMTLTTAGLIFGILGAVMKSRTRRPAAGAETMIGDRAVVVEWQGTEGRVRVQGEIWAARGDKPLQPKQTVNVVGRDGLILIVAR
jgi:membrane-bound serine protease (ClpP class)